jgi:hypothetical protein
MKLRHIRIKLDEANAFVAKYHRHHKPVVGHLFSLGAVLNGELVGVAIVGRPVARMRDDGVTAEVTRLCTDGVERKVIDRKGKEHDLGVCSFLYGSAARAAFALGFQRIGTYILASEPGTSLQGAGWRMVGQTQGGSWSRASRERTDKHPTEPKLLFEAAPSNNRRSPNLRPDGERR